MANRFYQPLLFIAGCVFFSMLIAYIPATPVGTFTAALAFWLSFYPLASTTALGPNKYWRFLVLGAPVVVVVRHYSGQYQPALRWLALAIFGVSLATVAVRWLSARRAR